MSPFRFAGGFAIEGLSAGRYRLCVQAKGGELLDPCQWQQLLPELEVEAGQTVRGHQITLEEGVVVEIEVDDPVGRLPSRASPREGVELLVGVWTPRNTFYPAPVANETGRGRTHQVVVPYETALELSVEGRGLQVDDETGKRLRKSDAPQRFKVDRGQPPKRFRFTVQ